MEINSSYDWVTISSFIIFILISWMVWTNYRPWIQFEKKVGSLFQEKFGNPELTYSDGMEKALLTFLVTYGSAPYLSMLTVVIAVILFIKGYLSLAIGFLAIMSTGGIFGILLKNVFKRPRPKDALASENGYSFPSGHAIASSIFFMTILLLLIPLIGSSLLKIFLTALILIVWFLLLFSRLYFHAHHLGDLIVGVSYAIFWVRAGIFIYQGLINLI